ncbi:MAG: rod shape-determining protein RodA [Bacillota bacterium]
MNIDLRLLRNLDKLLVIVIAALIAIGLVVISSAARGFIGPEGASGFVIKQAVAAVLGTIVLSVILLFDYSEFGRMWTFIYGTNLVLLGAVLAIGKTTNGAQAWIGLGPVHIEPGEYGKVMLILTLAHQISRMDRVQSIWDLISIGLHVLPPLALIMLQPDLGTALVYVCITAAMLFVAGFPLWKLALLGGAPVAGVVGWVVAHLHWGVPIILEEYQIKRLTNFINPLADISGSGYQVFQSIIGIGSGGLWGKGLYQGTQNQLGFLPEQHTDFIFSVVGEELGFAGGLVILVLFMLLIWRIMVAAGQSKDRYGSLIATGVAAMIFFHVLENVGMTMGVMPVTGIPLPFVSYGGSSLMTNLMAMGLVLNVGMRRQSIMF